MVAASLPVDPPIKAGVIGLPFLSVILNWRVGLWPGAVFVIPRIVNLGFTSCFDLYGTVWAPDIDASYSNNPCGL